MENKFVRFIIRVLNILIPFMYYGLGAYYCNYYYELYSNTTSSQSHLRLSDFFMGLMFLGMTLIVWNIILGFLSFFKYFKQSKWFVSLHQWSRQIVVASGCLVLLLIMLL